MFLRHQNRPIVHLYAICWNDEYILKYFFRHYDELVDRYVMFDDGSTDSTLSILEQHPRVEIRRLPRLEVDSYVLAAVNIHDNCWKESRGLADWVITTAVDEFLYAPQLRSYLAECTRKGITAIPALGYQMLSSTLPASDHSLPDIVKRGYPDAMQNKLSIFHPNKIIETNHAVGRHSAAPVGQVKYPDTDVLLGLHYKFISLERTFSRHADLNEKLGSVDKENRWGSQFGWTKHELTKQWGIMEQGSVEDVFSRHYNPHLQHSRLTERWWRNAAPANRDSELADLTASVASRDRELADLRTAAANRDRELMQIKTSKAWRLGLVMRRIRLVLAPQNSRRARALRPFFRIIARLLS